MIRVIIVEDEFFAADELKDLISELGFYVTGVYHSGEQFFRETNWEFDIALLDIFLSHKMTGIDVAKKLKDRHKPFIFLTANKDRETLRAAAGLIPQAYLSKPFNPNDVAAILQIVSYQLMPKLELKGRHHLNAINPNDIFYIKSDDVYIDIHTHNGIIVQRKLLKEIVKELPDNFVRVHRSYIVNKNYIEQRKSRELVVRGEIIPLSRTYKQELGF